LVADEEPSWITMQERHPDDCADRQWLWIPGLLQGWGSAGGTSRSALGTHPA
jgi:hypothetical protein